MKSALWEYAVADVSEHHTEDEHPYREWWTLNINKPNSLGQHGWELVDLTANRLRSESSEA